MKEDLSLHPHRDVGINTENEIKDGIGACPYMP